MDWLSALSIRRAGGDRRGSPPHGAFDPTKMCAVGFSVGSSVREPYATCTSGPTTENSSDPQTPQRVWFPSSLPQTSSVSPPFRTRSCSRAIPPNGLNIEPLLARQLEQWQQSAYWNASATSYSTVQHSQRPHRSLGSAISGAYPRQLCVRASTPLITTRGHVRPAAEAPTKLLSLGE